MNLFLCKVRFDKLLENGIQKKVTEQYAVEALSFTEAEARIIEEVSPLISGDFEIKDISIMNISEVFDKVDGDKYYKVKVNFISLDYKTAKEVKSASYMLVKASDMESAKTNFLNGMKGTMADFEVEQYVETKIIDYYSYKR